MVMCNVLIIIVLLTVSQGDADHIPEGPGCCQYDDVYYCAYSTE